MSFISNLTGGTTHVTNVTSDNVSATNVSCTNLTTTTFSPVNVNASVVIANESNISVMNASAVNTSTAAIGVLSVGQVNTLDINVSNINASTGNISQITTVDVLLESNGLYADSQLVKIGDTLHVKSGADAGGKMVFTANTNSSMVYDGNLTLLSHLYLENVTGKRASIEHNGDTLSIIGAKNNNSTPSNINFHVNAGADIPPLKIHKNDGLVEIINLNCINQMETDTLLAEGINTQLLTVSDDTDDGNVANIGNLSIGLSTNQFIQNTMVLSHKQQATHLRYTLSADDIGDTHLNAHKSISFRIKNIEKMGISETGIITTDNLTTGIITADNVITGDITADKLYLTSSAALETSITSHNNGDTEFRNNGVVKLRIDKDLNHVQVGRLICDNLVSSDSVISNAYFTMAPQNEGASSLTRKDYVDGLIALKQNLISVQTNLEVNDIDCRILNAAFKVQTPAVFIQGSQQPDASAATRKDYVDGVVALKQNLLTIYTPIIGQSLQINPGHDGVFSTIGFCRIGRFGSLVNMASFSHKDSTDYSLAQTASGITFVNSAVDQRLHFRIGNTDALVVHNNRNIGINRLNPDSMLHVFNSDTTQDVMKLQSDGKTLLVDKDCNLSTLGTITGSIIGNLAAGTNITLTETAGVTTINSSGGGGGGDLQDAYDASATSPQIQIGTIPFEIRKASAVASSFLISNSDDTKGLAVAGENCDLTTDGFVTCASATIGDMKINAMSISHKDHDTHNGYALKQEADGTTHLNSYLSGDGLKLQVGSIDRLTIDPIDGNVHVVNDLKVGGIDVIDAINLKQDTLTTSSNIIGDALDIGPDTALRATIGYTVIHSPFPDQMAVSHIDHATSTNYSLIQNPAGKSILNRATGQTIDFREGNTTQMSIKAGGDVDIMPDTDASVTLGRTCIYSAIADFMSLSHFNRKNVTDYAIAQNANGITYINCANAGGFQRIVFLAGGLEQMRMSSNGYFGIGTTTPDFPLSVYGNSGSLTATGYYFSESVSTLTSTTSYGLVSAYIEKDLVVGGAVGTASDSRIKKDVVDVSDVDALQKMRDIKPRTFKYIDNKRNTSEIVYGYIAQEVHSVFPEATKPVTDVVPNINAMCAMSGNVITMDTTNLETDIDGVVYDRLIVYDANEVKIKITFTVVDDTHIEFENHDADIPLTGDDVFVYGQEVDNFLTIEKSYIACITTSAVQEVDKLLTAEKAKTALLETQMADVLARLVAAGI